MSALLLHQECLQGMPVIGEVYETLLEQRSREVAAATEDLVDPNISVVVRARNERERLEGLFADFAQQKFAGEVQIIVVDSGSTDGTRAVASEHGAQVVHIDQEAFSHPKALNLGFEAAEHDLILTMVAHSNLTTNVALSGITRWASMSSLAGIYGPAALPDAYSSVWEKILAAGMHLDRRLGPAAPVAELETGAMVTHRAVFSKAAWRELGGFDLKYGAGGEDKAMARRMLEAGMTIVREPVLSIFHSHGTNLTGTIKQALAYRRLRNGAATQFNASQLGYRRDLGLNRR